jgi:Fis family transcriptional regulator, factor for inversion stimulation protein
MDTTLTPTLPLALNQTAHMPLPLRETVQRAVENYFAHLDGQPATELYLLVLSEVEEPLLTTVMRLAAGNQSLAAQWLGLSRNTLRKKLEYYGLL